MRISGIALLGSLAATFLFSAVLLAQHAPPPAGWPLCPRCQGPQDRAEARAKYKVQGHPFDPHDLSGVWGNNGRFLMQWGMKELDGAHAIAIDRNRRLYVADRYSGRIRIYDENGRLLDQWPGMKQPFDIM